MKDKILNHRFLIPDAKCYFAVYADKKFTYHLRGEFGYAFEITLLPVDKWRTFSDEEELVDLLDVECYNMSIDLFECEGNILTTYIENVIDYTAHKFEINLN